MGYETMTTVEPGVLGEQEGACGPECDHDGYGGEEAVLGEGHGPQYQLCRRWNCSAADQDPNLLMT